LKGPAREMQVKRAPLEGIPVPTRATAYLSELSFLILRGKTQGHMVDAALEWEGLSAEFSVAVQFHVLAPRH
jgi:hypothetical protein